MATDCGGGNVAVERQNPGLKGFREALMPQRAGTVHLDGGDILVGRAGFAEVEHRAGGHDELVGAHFDVARHGDRLTFVDDAEAIFLVDGHVLNVVGLFFPVLHFRIFLHDHGSQVLAVEHEDIGLAGAGRCGDFDLYLAE